MDVDLLPTEDELSHAETSFFPNIIRGEYPDVSAYLDIHYSLLREDFIRPVREAISVYKKNPRKKVDSLTFFPEVQFGKVRKISHEIGIEVQFSDRNSCEDEDWENSKHLLRGSLLFFSADDFKTYTMGTVLHRDVTQLKRGIVTVQLHLAPQFLFEESAARFVMAECDTFFLPYCNVMSVLRTLQESTFPFQSEIIFAHKDSFPPEYLNDLSEYSLPVPNEPVVVPVFQIRTAVTAEALALNEWQFSAVATALQRRIALIQGPPGTGKTYVGSKIVEILLKNSHIWNGEGVSPMLIVCASNQALDQFAERVLAFTEDIIRIGEQSKSKLLEKYNLNVIRRRQASEIDKTQQRHEMKVRYRNMMISWDNLIKIVEKMNDIRRKGGDVDYLLTSLNKTESEYRSTVRLFKKEQQRSLESILIRANVIAMTTTRAASLNNILKRIKPPIVIVEEAAELFEAHVIASLTNSCKHLILIGDHQQLRPIASDPLFAQETNLDVSLFERLITNDVVHEVLHVQHRMKPELCELLTQAFYEDLRNHTSTTDRSDIIGMRKNLFFMSHPHKEEKHAILSGYVNQFEAILLVEFASYLVSKGHKAQDITILTPYTLQARLIRKIQQKKKNLSECFTTTIDGFQGQENKIVLISWVRNGSRIGFLGTTNRISVALSRARDGLYMVGDLDLLMSNSSTWRKLGNYLKAKNLTGAGLPIDSAPHSAEKPEDFRIQLLDEDI